ncbi:MAG: extracellular solute-binding protein [Vampirovibrionales bacterium]|nr:extracellular solute-binding protein [Vampirovibrionales bacterium]
MLLLKRILKSLFAGFWLTTLIALGAMHLGGCQSANHEREQATPVTLTLWTLQMQPFETLVRKAITDFEHQHPGVRVQWEDLPFAEGKKRALAAVLSPRVPDVINLNPGFAALLAQRGALLDMNTELSAEQQADYVPVVWEAVQLQRRLTAGRPVGVGVRHANIAVGLPWYVTTTVTMSNAALLKQAGWQHPPETLAELEQLGHALKPLGYKALMPAIAENGAFLKLLRRAGLEPVQNGCLVWAGLPEVRRQLAFYKRLYDARLIPAESLTAGHRAAVEQYLSGRLALLSSGPNFLGMVKDNAPEVYAQTQVSPAIPMAGYNQHAYLDVSAMVLSVPSKSAHPKLAIALARTLAGPEFQLALAKTVPVLPSVKAAYAQAPAFFGLTPSATPRVHTVDSAMTAGRWLTAQQLLGAKATNPVLPNEAQLNTAVDYAIQSVLLDRSDIPEALSHAEQRVNAGTCVTTAESLAQ